MPDLLGILLLACLGMALLLLHQGAKLRRPGRPPFRRDAPPDWPIEGAYRYHYDEDHRHD